MENQSANDDVEKEPSDHQPDDQNKGKNNTLTILLFAALALALAAIGILLIVFVFNDGDDTDSGDSVAPPPPAEEEIVNFPFEGTDWIRVGAMEGTNINVIFAGGSLSGFAGCNSYSGSYRSTRAGGPTNDITVSSLTNTSAICDEPIMNQEQAYLSSLASASSYTIQGDRLSLTTGGGTLSFAAAQAALRPAE